MTDLVCVCGCNVRHMRGGGGGLLGLLEIVAEHHTNLSVSPQLGEPTPGRRAGATLLRHESVGDSTGTSRSAEEGRGLLSERWHLAFYCDPKQMQSWNSRTHTGTHTNNWISLKQHMQPFYTNGRLFAQSFPPLQQLECFHTKKTARKSNR